MSKVVVMMGNGQKKTFKDAYDFKYNAEIGMIEINDFKNGAVVRRAAFNAGNVVYVERILS